MKYPKQVRQQVEEAIVRQSLEHPELGADKIGRLVRNHGMRVSNQRVRTLRRNEGLMVPSPKKRSNAEEGYRQGKHPRKPHIGDMYGAGTSSMIEQSEEGVAGS